MTIHFAAVAKQIVDSILRETGLALHPPTDLYAVADRLGVREVRVGEMPQDGRLEFSNGTFVVTLARHTNANRRRFTFAHELGHVLLADGDDEFVAHRGSVTAATDVERFCDAFAAELLVPTGWLIKFASRFPPALESVRAVAFCANVSKTAAFLRLRDVLGWEQSLLVVQRVGRAQWRVNKMYRRTRGLHSWPRPSLEACSKLDMISGRYGDKEWRGTLNMYIAGSAVPFEGSVLAAHGFGLVLGRVTPAHGQSSSRRRSRLARLDVQGIDLGE